jgi:hypothetical protein
MALFRKKKKDEEADPQAVDEAAGERDDLADLAPTIRHWRREKDKQADYRKELVTLHLQAIHRPGGLAAVKKVADFMDLGTGRAYLGALSDLEFTIRGQYFAVDTVATEWEAKGVHTGELCGVPPSGQPVTIAGVTTSVIRENVVRTEYTYWSFPPALERLADP